MAKKKQKTDNVITQIGGVGTEQNYYVIKLMVIVDGKDGLPKSDCPIELYADNQLMERKATDSEGHVYIELHIPYNQKKKDFSLMAKVQGSTARELKTIQLPIPQSITSKVKEIKDKKEGYFDIPVEICVYDKNETPRPNTSVSLSYREEEVNVVTDDNGKASYNFQGPFDKTGEKQKVVASIGTLKHEIEFTLPEEIKAKKLLNKIWRLISGEDE